VDERVVSGLVTHPDADAPGNPPAGSRVGPTTRLECKVCWYVYDPAQGDAVWQVPAGTPFYALPEHWTCPQCGGERSQFLVLPDE
jgi:rubredoxin